MELLVAVQLFTVHMIDGRPVEINPKQIVRIQPGREDDDPHKTLADGVRCVIWFTDGSFLSVSETCEVISKLMRDTP